MESDAEQLVTDFLGEYGASGGYSRDRIARLAELAFAEDASTSESATRALFTALVEKLADSFEPDSVSLYNRAFAQVIQACRRDPRAAQLDQQLEAYGLRSEDDLIARAGCLRQAFVLPDLIDSSGKIERVIVLSRVTLGADVVITSVMIERMKLRFPVAEIVLVGGSKTPELFGGDPRVSFREIVYRRTGTTIERLLTWIELLRCIRDLTSGLNQGEYLIVDPDSRQTQLGLLPIGCVGLRQRSWQEREQDRATNQRDYLFFPSREYGSGTSRALSELTSLWLDEVFDETVPTHPRVSLRRSELDTARNLVTRMKGGSRPIVAINFGVGENQLKRVSGDFEATLVARLIQDGALIVLDKGAGDEERGRANAIIGEATRIERDGRLVRAVEVDPQSVNNPRGSGSFDAEILVWSGGIGMLGALIGECDLYIGYDSAGQHIAAALGVRGISVFAGFSSQRVLERWRPTGRSETRVVAVDTLRGGGDANQVVAQVLQDAREMLRSRSQIRNRN